MLIGFILVFLSVNILIGYLASRRVKDAGDFVQAGRKLPMFMNATALFALWFGSETVFGASGSFLDEGLSGVIEDPFGGVLALVLFGMFYVRKLYRLNLLTLNDLLRDKYGKTAELTSGFFMIISFFGYIAAQLAALSIIMHAIYPSISVSEGLIICSVIVTLYTFIGGMWAVSLTDFVQSILIIIGLVVLAVYLTGISGGVQQVFSAADENTFRFLPENNAKDVTQWSAAWLVLGLGSLCSQDIFQRANSARSEKAAVRSTYLGALLYLFFALLPLYIALCARHLLHGAEINDTEQVLPKLVLEHTPMYVQILFFGSLLSAILSTCSGALLAPASILSENIIRPFSRDKWSDRKFLFILRGSVVFMALTSTLMALFTSQGIYELVGESSILGMVSLLVPITSALYWKRASKAGAMCSMFGGMLAWIVFEYGYILYIPYPFGYIPTFIPALAVSVIGMIAGSYLVKNSTD